jgi:hypothetical protein
MALNWLTSPLSKGQAGFKPQQALNKNPNMQANNPDRYNRLTGRVNNLQQQGRWGNWKPGALNAQAKDPNFGQLWNMQNAANQQAQKQDFAMNRPNQTNDYSSVSWDYDPATGQYTQKETLSANNQARLGWEQGREGQLQGMFGNMVNDFNSGYGGQKAQDTAYNALMSRMNPALKQQQQELEQSLYDRGIAPDSNSKAWNESMNQFGQTRTDAELQAANQAISVGEGMRSNRLSQLSGLQGMFAGVQKPGYASFNGIQVDKPDIMNSALNYNKMMYDREQAAKMMAMGGGGGGGGYAGYNYPDMPADMGGGGGGTSWGDIGMSALGSLGSSFLDSFGSDLGESFF